MFKHIFYRKFLVSYFWKNAIGESGVSCASVDTYDIYILSDLLETLAKLKKTAPDKIVILNIIPQKRQFLWWYF